MTFDYVARGGEKYLTIGSFKEDMTEEGAVEDLVDTRSRPMRMRKRYVLSFFL